ncbi:hypothetical protein SFRURICE_003516 [Spodoptera frugiperda]|nr:hypothetical protein SFRURICE_003516 [Spodoptera frugiperda]
MLIAAINNRTRFDFETLSSLNNSKLMFWTGFTFEQFSLRELIFLWKKERSVLGAYLTKIRTGEPHERLTTLFGVTRQVFEYRLKIARLCLTGQYVPRHLDTAVLLWNALPKEIRVAKNRSSFKFKHTSREEVTQRNLLIPNNLFGCTNTSVEQMPVIAICDGTYIFIKKSSNYLYQKKTYSLHKYDNLIKPFLIVACDGYIIDVSGPYAATQTDSEIMKNLFENENVPMRCFFRSNDVFILDRGFRDCIPFLESYGYKVFRPESVDEGETQLTTLQANKSRCVTLCRWVVEVLNGRFKRDYKLLRQDFFNRVSLHLMDDFRIAAALINRFHPLIQDRPDAQEITSRALHFKKMQ